MMRRALYLCVLGACGGGANGGDDDGRSGPPIEVSTDVLDQVIGAPIGLAFTDATVLSGPFSCFAPASDGALFKVRIATGGTGIQLTKIAPNGGSAMWTTALMLTGSETDLDCALAPTPDGGAVFVGAPIDGQASAGVVAIGVSATGVQRWRQDIATKTQLFTRVIAALPSGTVVIPIPMSAPGVIDSQSPLMLVGLDGLDGHQVFSTELPDEVVDGVGDGVTNGVANSGNNPPDRADAEIHQILPTADGGFAVVGEWQFSELIECGSELDPQVPSEHSCGFGNDDAMLVRFDAAGALRWKVRIGAPYATPTVAVDAGTELSDGSIIAVGSSSAGLADDPFERGFAFRVDPSGTPVWAKAYLWDSPPGETFLSGGTTFIGAVPTDAGVRLVVAPPMRAQTSCPIVELDSSGALVRAQTVDFPHAGAVSFGADLYLLGVNAVSKVVR